MWEFYKEGVWLEELEGVTKLNHDLDDTVSVFDLKQLPRDSQL